MSGRPLRAASFSLEFRHHDAMVWMKSPVERAVFRWGLGHHRHCLHGGHSNSDHAGHKQGFHTHVSPLRNYIFDLIFNLTFNCAGIINMAVKTNLWPRHNKKNIGAMKAARAGKRITFDCSEASLSKETVCFTAQAERGRVPRARLARTALQN